MAKAAYVVWLDACGTSDCHESEIPDAVYLHVVGWVIWEDKKQLKLALERGFEDQGVRETRTIPKQLIVYRKNIPIKVMLSKQEREVLRKAAVYR